MDILSTHTYIDCSLQPKLLTSLWNQCSSYYRIHLIKFVLTLHVYCVCVIEQSIEE